MKILMMMMNGMTMTMMIGQINRQSKGLVSWIPRDDVVITFDVVSGQKLRISVVPVKVTFKYTTFYSVDLTKVFLHTF